MDELKVCPFCREKDKDIAYLKRRLKAEEDGYMEESKMSSDLEMEVERLKKEIEDCIMFLDQGQLGIDNRKPKTELERKISEAFDI